jgi:hypothetical protein
LDFVPPLQHVVPSFESEEEVDAAEELNPPDGSMISYFFRIGAFIGINISPGYR